MTTCWLLSCCMIAAAPRRPAGPPDSRPNIILILTDDQGYGDYSLHGNPVLETPNIDRIAREGVQVRNFYVAPVCSPTRASLLTGRYNYRTGVVDTYCGRSMMFPDEVTIAERLKPAGYRTGIFGKWHLGDNCPLRPQDQGFDEALVHRGGGIGQPSDPPGATSYFDPMLLDDGVLKRFPGYCSDIYTDRLVDFIRRRDQRPFFAYLAFNCPHTPLEAKRADVDFYLAKDLQAVSSPMDEFTTKKKAKAAKRNENSFLAPADTAKLYGMIRNIDHNVGRVMAALKQTGIDDDTLVVFLNDNGPQQPRYNAGLRGLKGTPFEGGTKAGCFWRWPRGLPAGTMAAGPAAHIDVLPTVMSLAGIAPPEVTGVPATSERPTSADLRAHRLDGIDLSAHLRGAQLALPERNLYFQWHRGEVPERRRAFAVRSAHHRLVQPNGVPEKASWQPRYMLFDVDADPGEKHDLAETRPEVVARMLDAYDAWFVDVTAARGSGPDGWAPSIALSGKEDPVTLTRQDWRGPDATWEARGLGHWRLLVGKAGSYDLDVLMSAAPPADAKVQVYWNDRPIGAPAALSAASTRLGRLALPAERGDLRVEITDGEGKFGPHQVSLHRVE